MTEGTGPKNPTTSGVIQAQVTYRGVSYDSAEYRNMVQAEAKQRNFDLMYRGVKVSKKLVSA